MKTECGVQTSPDSEEITWNEMSLYTCLLQHTHTHTHTHTFDVLGLIPGIWFLLVMFSLKPPERLERSAAAFSEEVESIYWGPSSVLSLFIFLIRDCFIILIHQIMDHVWEILKLKCHIVASMICLRPPDLSWSCYTNSFVRTADAECRLSSLIGL